MASGDSRRLGRVGSHASHTEHVGAAGGGDPLPLPRPEDQIDRQTGSDEVEPEAAEDLVDPAPGAEQSGQQRPDHAARQGGQQR